MRTRDAVSGSTPRAIQRGFLALLFICVAQLAWWMIDEYRYTDGIRAKARAEYVSSAEGARALLASGVPWATIAAAHPELTRATDGSVLVAPDALARLDAERFHRLNRYAWEGGFFLVVLLAAMSAVRRALKEERALRDRQELFLAAVTHELKSPMASLRLSAETLALRDPPAERRGELVRRLLADVGRLDRITSNVLEAARITVPGVKLVRERVDLAREVASVVEELQLLAAEGGVTITQDVPTALTLHADRQRVHTVLRNLVHNAIKAAARPHPASASVHIAASADDGYVRLDVRDDGIGFDATEGARLGEKFYRIEHAGRERLPGTGLGLFLVRRCMTLESGAMQAVSAGPGRGACFTVRWPMPERAA